MVDGGFTPTPTNTALEDLADTIHITGRQEPGSDAPAAADSATAPAPRAGSATSNAATACADPAQRRQGHQIWDGWAALTYNADTYTTLG